MSEAGKHLKYVYIEMKDKHNPLHSQFCRVKTLQNKINFILHLPHSLQTALICFALKTDRISQNYNCEVSITFDSWMWFLLFFLNHSREKNDSNNNKIHHFPFLFSSMWLSNCFILQIACNY